MFTPEIETALAWFFATHEHAGDRWRRTSLPAAGGVGDQDCRLMAEQDFLAGVFTRIVMAERERTAPRRPRTTTQK